MQLVEPRATLSHHSAAAHWRLPLPEHSVGHVTVPRGLLRHTVHVAQVHETRHLETMVAADVLVTSPVRAFIDPADHVGLVDLLVLGDAAVRHELLSRRDRLDETAPASHRRVLGRSQSPLGSRQTGSAPV